MIYVITDEAGAVRSAVPLWQTALRYIRDLHGGKFPCVYMSVLGARAPVRHVTAQCFQLEPDPLPDDATDWDANKAHAARSESVHYTVYAFDDYGALAPTFPGDAWEEEA